MHKDKIDFGTKLGKVKFDVNDYRPFIKTKCIKCFKPIENPEQNYMARGNWCKICHRNIYKNIAQKNIKKIPD